MPTRSIQVRLIVPRGQNATALRQSLWTTHAATNEATDYYERRLLLLRGQGYAVTDRTVSEAEIRQKALRLARDAQRRNRSSLEGSDEEILDLLRRLYEHIVPTAITLDAAAQNANAQNANAFLGPLTDRESKGFLLVFEKLKRPRPDWLELVEEDHPGALEAAGQWWASEEAEVWRSDTGSPPSWLRLARKSDPGWPRAFSEKLKAFEKEASEGKAALVRRLKDLGLLPLFPPCLSPRIEGSSGTLSPWDRLGMRLAVAHLLSWESWCRRASEEYDRRRARVEAFKNKVLTDDTESAVGALRGYETARVERLGGEADYRIMPRQLRGWSDLREKWLKSNDCTESSLLAILANEQTRQGERFGDPDVFRWLAKPDNHFIWKHEDDVVSFIATLNAMQSLVERSKETATMTLPDARRHPRATQWEPPGGSNLRHYVPYSGAVGAMAVELQLLAPVGQKSFRERTETLQVAPSGQMCDVTFKREPGEKVRVEYTNAAGEHFAGILQSADLLFKTSHLRGRELDRLEAGDVGPLYLKLALDLDKNLPPGWPEKRPPAVTHFQTASGGRSKHEEQLEPGLRVLAVDLGIRTFASCAVFELLDAPPDERLAFEVPLEEGRLWAVHERSFKLTMPGESADRETLEWRMREDAELRSLCRILVRYRRIMRMSSLEGAERKQSFEDLKAGVMSEQPADFELEAIGELAACTEVPLPDWQDAIKACLTAYRQDMAVIVKEWRRRTRARNLDPKAGKSRGMGKSMWAIEHLTRVRRFLISWSLLGRESGEIRRLDREKQGIFAARLLEHIEHIKDDRRKTGADLIVQAARGYLRDRRGCWEQRYQPCHLILFEDLSRYRMRSDRPRRENRQLMKWAHRAVPKEVKMQGELYGLWVTDISAAFSSRYAARTNTPGIRCRSLKKSDLANRDILERLAKDGFDGDALKAADIVPWVGGEWFAFLNDQGHAVMVHADINAAQNLQRRFWTRHAEAFRLPCRLVRYGDRNIWVPRSLGKRQQGALGGFCILSPTGHPTGSCRLEAVSRQKFLRLGGATVREDEAAPIGVEEELLEGLEEAALEHQRDRMTFFRDPSGCVLQSDLWYPSKTFWGIVRKRTVGALKKRLETLEQVS